MTPKDRATALLAAGKLTTSQQVRAVALGLLTPAQCSPEARAAITNAATIRTQAAAALTANRTYLAIGAPTNAQVVAQVKALTRQSSGALRLLLSQLDGVE